jgi:predicted TPR repeat methyltransferase
LFIAIGSGALIFLPELPGHADIALGALWLLFAGSVLCWQLLRLILNQRHLLCARLGWNTRKAPAGYIRALFDSYAERYDQHLLVQLNYAVPNLIRGAVGQRLDGSSPIVADLGCGTGVCGPLLRPLAARLIGVDLSPAMLAKAERRKVYDELIEADLVAFLGLYENHYDLCIAADVFCYIGDLLPVVRAAAAALDEGGYFVFTVESIDKPGWVLQSTGRYAHQRAYVGSLACQTGFSIEQVDSATLRTQSGKPVAGDVWLLRQPH